MNTSIDIRIEINTPDERSTVDYRRAALNWLMDNLLRMEESGGSTELDAGDTDTSIRVYLCESKPVSSQGMKAIRRQTTRR